MLRLFLVAVLFLCLGLSACSDNTSTSTGTNQSIKISGAYISVVYHSTTNTGMNMSGMVPTGPAAQASAVATNALAPGDLYMTIFNTSATADRLLSVKTQVARNAELHTTTYDNGKVGMHKIDDIVVPANGSVALVPGGYHIMLMDFTQPLEQGEIVPVTLQFEKAGSMNLQVEVRRS